MTSERRAHEPVLVEAVLDLTGVRQGGVYVDATAGLGGHSVALLAAGAERLLAMDVDPQAARELRAVFVGDARVSVAQGNFRQLGSVAARHGFDQVDGVLLDLGVSLAQLQDPARGFSFQYDGPIDMRFDPTRGTPALELVNRLPEPELAELIRRYGEERRARGIARRIVEQRSISSTVELARVIARAMPGRRRIHPATRTFQALRIATNDELDALAEGLEAARSIARDGGRIAVVAFHSLEDRIVKNRFRDWARLGVAEVLTPKPVRPEAEEMARNRRSRSARLRAARIRKAA